MTHDTPTEAAVPAPKKLTAVQEDYLAVIYREESAEGAARGCHIAKASGVTRSTVAMTLRALKAAGYVDYEPYGPIRLTEAGRAVGKAVADRRSTLREFFENVMKLDAEAAERFSHELEHCVTADTLRRFDRFNTFYAAHAAMLKF